jgi:hypothetical protein
MISMSELRVTSNRFDSPGGPAAEIYSRIRASVARTPASSIRTHTRIAASVAAVSYLAGGAVIIASQIVYGRQGVGLDFGVHSTSHMLLVLFSLVALTFFTTFAAVRQGKHGLGSGVLALMMIVGLAIPIYAGLTVVSPVHDNAAAGLWAGVGVFIFCPSGNEQHLLVGHVLPILAFTLLGAIATPHALRP